VLLIARAQQNRRTSRGDRSDDVNLTYERIKKSFLVLEVVVMKVMSMSEILARILGGIIFSISILDIIFSTDFYFGYEYKYGTLMCTLL
jgi:hypothetical protein